MNFRNLFTLIFLLIGLQAIAQDLDSLGIEINTMLNHHEAKFLKDNLKHEPADYNFTDKLVAFLYYENGKFVPQSKIDFFADAKNYYLQSQPITDQIIILTPKERMKCEGFDIVIISGYPNPIDNNERNLIIKRIKKIVLRVYYGDGNYFDN